MTLGEVEAELRSVKEDQARLVAALARLVMVLGGELPAEAADPVRDGFREFRKRARADLSRRAG